MPNETNIISDLEQALEVAQGMNSLTTEEKKRLLDPSLPDEERGELWLRFLASDEGADLLGLLTGEEEATEVSEIFQAEAKLSENLQRFREAIKNAHGEFLSLASLKLPVEKLKSLFSSFQDDTLLLDAPLLRGAQELESLKLLSPTLEMPCYPYTFYWTPVEGVDVYFIELIDDNLETIWSGEVKEATMAYPQDVPFPKPGQPLTWRVTVEIDGKTVSRSEQVIPIEDNEVDNISPDLLS